MKRGLPFFSPAAIGLALAVLIILGIAFWTKGGLGFSPGQVSAKSIPGVTLNGYTSHASFESNCGLCHRPLQSSQNLLCLDCHRDVQSQMSTHTGTHGNYPPTQHCADCHNEHKGRDYDPTRLALASFDHNHTDFPLTGQHTQLQCNDCHKTSQFSQVSTTCSGCHVDPDIHKGLFSSDCASCHTTSAWTPVIMNGKPFDHNTVGFSLNLHQKDYSGNPINCIICHSYAGQAAGQPGSFQTQVSFNRNAQSTLFQIASGNFTKVEIQTCINCHSTHDQAFIANHTDQFGSACMDCHDGVDRLSNFNHNNFFVLDGKHSSLDCTTCHTDHKFRGTPSRCVDCHAEPQVHAGFFGLACEDCHTTSAWNPAMLRIHTFPLDHGSKTGPLACQTCHPKTDMDYTCYSCHDHQPDEIQASHLKAGIPLADIPNCMKCHPGGIVEKQ